MIFPTTDYAKGAHKYEILKPVSESPDFDIMKGESASSSPQSTLANTPVTGSQQGLNEQLQSPSSGSGLASRVVMRRRFTSENESQMDVDDDDSAASSSVPRVGEAFYNYTATKADELSFDRGSVVEILNKDGADQGWIYARIGGVEGVIPENYVRLVGRQLKEIKGSELKKPDERPIGTGAFSNVYKSMWKGNGVALKQPKDLKQPTNLKLTSAELVESIKQEALIYARLKHENIVGFYGICFDMFSLVLELCNGGTLFNLNRQLAYSIPIRVVSWSLQIAKGMEHLHNREKDNVLIHADLKADNVLLKEKACLCDHVWDHPRKLKAENFQNGKCKTCGNTSLDHVTLKLTDFGLSRIENSKSAKVLGSFPWMAPEVPLYGQYSKASDVYSFGCVVWELITNQTPFHQLDGNEVLTAVCDYKKPEIPEDCPGSLSRLMVYCWQEDPKNRPSFTNIIEDLKQAQIYADSKQKLDYKNSKKIKMTDDEVERFKREIYFPRELTAYKNLLNVEGPKIAPRKNNKPVKIDKSAIGSPSNFQHIMTVHDNQNRNDTNQRYQVEYPTPNGLNTDVLGNSTLPRNYKHSTHSMPNHIQSASKHLRSHSKGAQSAPSHLQDNVKNGPGLPKIVRQKPAKKSSNPLTSTNSHGLKRNENEGYNDDHLNPMRFGPPLKAAKSNPELAGPNSLLIGKNSRIQPMPLDRSNAIKKRNIEPDNSSKAGSVISSNSTNDNVVDLADLPPGPVFRDNQASRNQSESSVGFDPNSTASQAGSVRAKQGQSVFYVDEEEEVVDPTVSLTSQDAQNFKKRPGIGSFLKNLGGNLGEIFSSPKATPITDAEPPVEPTSMLCDRPKVPGCFHPNHTIDLLSNKTHLCFLAEVVLTGPYVLKHEPELEEFIGQPAPPQTEARSSPRPFVKAADDPQRKRRAGGILAQNGGNAGSKTAPSQIAQRHKSRQSTSVSEADEQMHSSNEALSECTTPTDIFESFDYEPVRIGAAHSSGDLRQVGLPMHEALADTQHQRSRSSDTRPEEYVEDYMMDWSESPITNSAYVPLSMEEKRRLAFIQHQRRQHAIRFPGSTSAAIEESELYIKPNAIRLQASAIAAVNLNGNGAMDTSLPPKSSAPPAPAPRLRPMNLGPGMPLPAPVENINWRPNHQSPSSDSHQNSSPHRKKHILNTEVRGSAAVNNQPTSRKHTPEPVRPFNLDTPVSAQDVKSTPQTPEKIVLYEETTLPISNPNYKSQAQALALARAQAQAQAEQFHDDIYMALPSQRAPLPPTQHANIVPKFLPNQIRKVSPRPPNPSKHLL